MYIESKMTTEANGSTNYSWDEWLMMNRGPKRLNMNIVIPITVVYVVIFATGVIGNIAVCLVIARTRILHTATNFYLASLAMSDLTFLLLGLPNDLSLYWQPYPWTYGLAVCKLRAVVSEMSSYTSVLTIVAFSMERYLAICHPLYTYSMSGLRRAMWIICALWTVSFVCALPFAVFTKVNYIQYPPNSGITVPESAFCGLLKENIPQNAPIYELSTICFFLVPMFIIVLLYVRIRRVVRDRNRHSIVNSVLGENYHNKARKSVIRMLTAVVVTFFLCWAPFHLQRVLYIYVPNSAPYWYEINEWLYYITGCFYYFSSTVNPFLYNVMSVKYRLAFRQLLCWTDTNSSVQGESLHLGARRIRSDNDKNHDGGFIQLRTISQRVDRISFTN
ncbi:neuropeptides capa receptor-like [Nilaparvata lugens]|uniref:neuropeptides capa receptor-like n=1 Tax=Nilaparvata lugens TaxID=108931 RepID=UPI00193CF2AE|nr:neuropeptides capa receptor-like [Nilaparvata lugens]